MTDKAAFRATYSDWRLVKTRKVVQIVLEVSIESADAAYQVLGGMPDPAAERWVAVARLQQEGDQSIPVERSPSQASPQSYAQWVGVLCRDPLFEKFCGERNGGDNVADFVRKWCDVPSRRDIVEATRAGRRWIDLIAEFKAWKVLA